MANNPLVRCATTVMVAALLLTSYAPPATAGSCKTFLAVGEVVTRPTPDGTVLDVSGTWEFDNALQVQLGLKLNVLVVQEDTFVRFPLLGIPRLGFASGLDDGVGLSGTFIQILEGLDIPEPAARILSFQPHRMQLLVPSTFPTGPVTVLMYLVQDNDYVNAFVSNLISLDTAAIGPFNGSVR